MLVAVVRIILDITAPPAPSTSEGLPVDRLRTAVALQRAVFYTKELPRRLPVRGSMQRSTAKQIIFSLMPLFMLYLGNSC